ncbi:hypothetical protein PUR71_23170 [Streptomyces sp. SP17BM10]|uniref:hypothetical protein n=1 Tax=Streptomyces sp. SP17BM10 TaxID=3002530 RepID=UPI002E789A26|nr:hypothetical protein [Streptomyces sp. SP17BM10]MEE1785783.1 hypothetical protein [Streptomyces sp. SP17BM10]
MIAPLESLVPATAPDAYASTTYADWAAAHDPGAAGTAREALEEMSGEFNRYWEKPGGFVDLMARRARRLPPAHLPWFWDTVGHRLLRNGARAAARAYIAARAAESAHGLPADPGYRRANALLFARYGALPAKELAAHQRFLAATLDPPAAHTALDELLTAWAASPADLPADLVRRARASAKAAGHGDGEAARMAGAILATARDKALPDALLNDAAPLLSAHPPTDADLAALADLFPNGTTDGGAWLRLLIACGAVRAMAEGRIVPEGGLHRWLGHFAHMYQYARQSGGGVSRQQLPSELLDVVGKFGPRLRAGGTAVTLHTTRYHWQGLDADLLDACLAAHVPVTDPGPETRMRFWGEDSRRDLAALAADPVFGPRLEGTVHAGLLPHHGRARRRAGTAITLLPGNDGIAHEVAARVTRLVDTVAGGGMAGAEEAVTELETILDRPTVTALAGITDALAEAGAAGALRRSLAAGLPEELAWPALESVRAEFEAEHAAGSTGIEGITCTWPVLTVFNRERAVAVDPDGIRATCRFTVPDDATLFTAHYAGGSFLISWTLKPNPYHCDTAIWADRPDTPFTPNELSGLVPYGGSLDGAYGFQFETADGTGRHSGGHVLRPGDTHGIDDDELQLGDGTRIWTNAVFGRRPWHPVDPVTGEPRDETPLPDFPGRPADPTHPAEAGMAVSHEDLQLAPLPATLTTSPLGSRDGLVGTRVLYRTRHRDHAPDHFLLESVDGRTARFDTDRPGQTPWGLWAPPEGAAEDVVLAESQTRTGVRAYTPDGTLLWEQDGHDTPRRSRGTPHRAVTVSGGTALPPAYWYLLRTRDRAASRALRAVTRPAAEALLAAACEGAEALRAAVARELPGVTDPVLVEAVAAVALRGARVEERRLALHRRVAILAEAPPVLPRRTAPDTELMPALFGLLPDGSERPEGRPAPLPATLGALAADGAHLAGAIGEDVRRLSPPAPPHEWPHLLGAIDAAAWRAATAPTPEAERTALLALLDTWADQPFARAGSRWWTGRADTATLARLRADGLAVASARVRGASQHWFVASAADTVAQPVPCARLVRIDRDDATRLRALVAAVETDGPLAPPEAAVAQFAELTGVRRPLARLVLAGLPARPGRDEHRALVTKAPYKATPMTADAYDELRERLGDEGRRAVLAAALPEDPADLWRPGGIEAAARRMAAAWCERLGARPAVDDEAADTLEADLGLSEVWARRLAGGYAAADDGSVAAVGWELALAPYASAVDARALPPAGPAPRYRTPVGLPLRQAASALVWAWTDRPVGDPAVAGAFDLYERLRAELARPELLLAVPGGRVADTPEGIAHRFGPERLRVADHRLAGGTSPRPKAYDRGPLVVCAPGGEAFVRPAALADPQARQQVDEVAELAGALAFLAPFLPGGGLERMAQRARTTPVPAGAYEADPRHSCPDLVTHAARHLDIGPDAAALYLQLATLAAPTDRNVRRWNAWTARQHTAARTELLATGTVTEAKRPRAGRTLFLTGEWTDLKSPHVPLETPKLATHTVHPLWRNEIRSPFPRIQPPSPLHELFTTTWTALHGSPAITSGGDAHRPRT